MLDGKARAVRIEDCAETCRGHRVVRRFGESIKPVTVPVRRTLKAWRGERSSGQLIPRPTTGNPSRGALRLGHVSVETTLISR